MSNLKQIAEELAGCTVLPSKDKRHAPPKTLADILKVIASLPKGKAIVSGGPLIEACAMLTERGVIEVDGTEELHTVHVVTKLGWEVNRLLTARDGDV